jgi:HEAT repeat protein
MAATLGPSAGPAYLQALRNDRFGPVRGAAAKAVGDTLYTPAHAALLDLAKDSRTPAKVLADTIYALNRLGDDTHTRELAKLLNDPDKYVRAEAVMVMAMIGQSEANRASAKVTLKRLMRDETLDPVVRLQVVEGLASLGDEGALGLLVSFTKNQYMEDRLVAIEGLGKTGDPQAIGMLQKIVTDSTRQPAERVAAADSLGVLHAPIAAGAAQAVSAVRDPYGVLERAYGSRTAIPDVEVMRLQTLGATALGHMGRREAVGELLPLLENPSFSVRVSAARSILILLPDYAGQTSPQGPSQATPPVAVVPTATSGPTTQPVEVPPAPPVKLETSGGKD